MKSLRLMTTMLLLAVFGMVSAQTEVFKETFDQTTGTGGNDGKWSGISAQGNIQYDGAEWTLTNPKGGDKCITVGGGSKGGKAVTPEINLTGNGTLTFKAGAWEKDKTGLKLSVTNAELDQTEITLTKGAFTDYTVKITNATAPIQITFESAAPKKNRFFLDEVVVTSESGTSKTNTTLTFGTPEGYSFVVADGEQTFTNKATLDPAVEGAVITYAIDNEEVAIIDGATGDVMTTGAVGTATVTATYEGNDSYNGSAATYTITVTDPNAKGTQNNPYSPSEALAAYAQGKLTTECYIKGIISNIQEVSTQYGNATYYISDDGTDNNPLYVFRGNWIGGEQFTAEDQIVVGGIVLVKGEITTYTKDGVSTIELNSGNEVVEYVAPVTVTIGQSKYASLYYEKQAFVVPQGMEAYTYKLNGHKVEESYMYAAGETIPAGTAVILKGEPNDYSFAFSTKVGDVDSENILKGTDSDTPLEADANSYFYKLSLNADEELSSIGFYWGAADGAAFTNKAHKAYLKVAKSAGAKFYRFDGETTAIENVQAAQPDAIAPMYNVAGQRVSKNYKGVVIQNGRKYVVK